MKEEIGKAIKELKAHKVPGIDGITTKMLKGGDQTIQRELRRLTNRIYNRRNN